MLTDFRLRQIDVTILAGADITERQAAALSEFNNVVFSKVKLEEVPFFKSLQNSLRK